MDHTITYRGTVYPWHCDHMGHMNVMWYVGKFDEALWNLFTGFGLAPAYLRAQQRGMAALQQTIHYKRELLAGDVVTVRSSVAELREKVVLIRQTMFNDAQNLVAATMDVAAVHLDTVARRSVPFAADIAERIRATQQGNPPHA